MAKIVKKAQSKREFLDADGAVVEDVTDAHGVRFTQLSNGKSVDLIPQSEIGKRLLMVFGVQTLASNEASATRQAKGDNADTIPDITERFSAIEEGTWAGERLGPQWNRDAMAEAAVLALIDSDKLNGTDTAQVSAKKDAIRRLIEDNKALAQVRAVAGVMDHYRDLTGKVVTPKSADDLLAMIA